MSSENLRKTIRWGALVSALCISWGLVACGDDQNKDPDGSAGDTGSGGTGTGGTGGTDPGQPGGDGNLPEEVAFPSFFSLTGDSCGFVSPRNQLFPICEIQGEITEETKEFTASCFPAGKLGEAFEVQGTIDGDGFTLSSEALAGAGRWAASGNTTLRCTAEKGVREAQQISCIQEGETKEAVCDFRPDSAFRPSVGCVELPSSFDSVASAGTTLSECQVVQDACAFQANCKEGSFAGQVGPEGIYGFSLSGDAASCRTDAQTANSLTGKCNVSDDLTISYSETVASCDALFPGEDAHLFALTADCGNPQFTGLVKPVIGDEPACAWRQRGCNWEVHCVQGNGQKLSFAGVLEEGQDKAKFAVEIPGGPEGSGFQVPCELGVEGGKLSGACVVPISQGVTATCELGEVASPQADTENCEDLSDANFDEFSTHGCGPVSTECKVGFQHKCAFIAACDFGLFEGQLMSGSVSKKDSRDVMSFNGVGGYQCEVQKVLSEEVGQHPKWADGTEHTRTVRVADEWYGTCRNPALPHVCRGTDAPAMVGPSDARVQGPYKGLRLFFGDRACGLKDDNSDACTLD